MGFSLIPSKYQEVVPTHQQHCLHLDLLPRGPLSCLSLSHVNFFPCLIWFNHLKCLCSLHTQHLPSSYYLLSNNPMRSTNAMDLLIAYTFHCNIKNRIEVNLPAEIFLAIKGIGSLTVRFGSTVSKKAVALDRHVT